MKFKFKGKEYYIDKILAMQLDTLIYNIKSDWDFVIIITGDRMVRTGKSVLALTICAYIASKLTGEFDLNHVFFESEKLIARAIKLPKYSVLLYDEARESLSVAKMGWDAQEKLLDYLAECGQLNQVLVCVMPDFFELRENIAVARSEILINVYRKNLKVMRDVYGTGPQPVVKFSRGYYEFFNRAQKQALYDIARRTRRKKYNLVKARFIGRFTNQYSVDEKKYRELKAGTLKRYRAERHKPTATPRDMKYKGVRDALVVKLAAENKPASEIRALLEIDYKHKISESTVKRIINDYQKKAKIANSPAVNV